MQMFNDKKKGLLIGNWQRVSTYGDKNVYDEFNELFCNTQRIFTRIPSGLS